MKRKKGFKNREKKLKVNQWLRLLSHDHHERINWRGSKSRNYREEK
jgi:hypothetical protein